MALDLNMNPEELHVKGDAILQHAKNIKEQLETIETAMNGLSSWQSQSKEKYDSKVKMALPRMNEMVDAIASYGGVANVASNAVKTAELSIEKTLDNDNMIA